MASRSLEVSESWESQTMNCTFAMFILFDADSDGDDPGDGDDPVGADDPGNGDADGDHLVQEEGGRAVLGKGVVCWRGL